LKQDSMNKITINFGGFICRMKFATGHLSFCNYIENIINKISNGYL